MNDDLQQELTLLSDNIRRFIADEIEPHYNDWEATEIMPRSVWNQLGEHGFLAVDIPEQHGGFGADFRYAMTIIDALSRANLGALSSSVTVHSDIVAHYILNHGNQEQRQRYLPGMVSGDCVGAIAMTEPGTGSDLQSIRTTAKREGDTFVINGSKTFITNGQHCDVVIVAARTNTEVAGSRGTSLLLVDTNLDGFQRGRNLEKIGLHAGDTSELFFEDVRVPESAVLGEIDKGFMVLMSELRRERLAVAVGAVAAAEGVLADTINYVRERKAFGMAIAEFQNTKFKLAEMATDVRIHRAFIDECTRAFIDGTLDVATVSMAKYSATEMQGRVCDGCLQLHGGYGYMREYGVSRAYVDARVQRIYGGTSEIMKELISRSLLQ
ncbi:MAG: acyl-CoA dehydrogenase family protein [Pseudomonadales bacterium]